MKFQRKNIVSFCGTGVVFIPASDMKNVHLARTCNTFPTREFMRMSVSLAWHINLKETL